MDHILTFQEWIETFHSNDSDPNPYLLEEGYVYYCFNPTLVRLKPTFLTIKN